MLKKLSQLISAVVLASSIQPSFAEKVIFDTDFAIDDWSALLVLAKHPAIELLAVTANGAGETRCAPAMKNIPALLDLTPAENVIIACGDDYPLDGYFTFPEPWRVQADTMSGIPLPASHRPVSETHAVEVLHKVLSAQAEPITVLTTGSLTNIAQLISRYPADKNKIARLVMMGGAFNVKGNILVPNFTDGHPNAKAEWNIYVDAKAADDVFTAGLPIEVVGLDVTNQVKVTHEFARDFKQKVSTPAAEFWDKVLDDNDWFIESGEYYFWDVLAALVVVEPSFCVAEEHPVWVSYNALATPSVWSNSAISATLANGQPRSHFDPATTGVTHTGGDHPPVKICVKTDAEKAFALFTNTLNQ